MRFIGRPIAVAAAAVVVGIPTLALALTTPASAASAGVGVAVGAAVPAAALPQSKILGTTAHFKPSKLSATAKWTGGTCTAAQESFAITNKEKVTESLTLTGTDHLKGGTDTLPSGETAGVCITSGYSGTVHVTLTDKKRLTVTF